MFIERAEGAEITDVDGNTYVDYVCSWGPLIHGHAHPAIVAAVTEAAGRGTSYGAPTAGEVELAELVAQRMPGVDMLRMTSSGTEASMSAIRLARAATGREMLLKFAGAYHGHVDGLLAQAGSGLATQGIPSSPGVPESAAAGTVDRAVERRRRRAGGLRGARVRRRARRAVPGQHGPRPARAGVPRAAARARHASTARCWSSTRSSPASASRRRRAGADRRDCPTSPCSARSSAAGCPPRPTAAGRADGADRAGRRRLPGRHAEREPARRGGRARDAGAARRGGLRPPRRHDGDARRRACARPPATGRCRSPGRPAC